MSEKKSQRKPRKANPIGLGDVVEQVTKATGIKAAVDWFSEKTGVDCGCDERKQKLNELFPFRSVKPTCLTKEQYDIINTIPVKWRKLDFQLRQRIAKVHAEVFSHKFSVPCTCAPKLWEQWVAELQSVKSLYNGSEEQA